MSKIKDIDCGVPKGIQDIPCRPTNGGGNSNDEKKGILAIVSMNNPSDNIGTVEHIMTVETINHNVEGEIYLYFKPSPNKGYINTKVSYAEDGWYLHTIPNINSGKTTLRYICRANDPLALEIRVTDSEGNEIHNADSILKGEYNG